MIKTKEDLKAYLLSDQKANYINKNRIIHRFPLIYQNMKIIYLMRKTEYFFNRNKKIAFFLYKKRMQKLCTKLGIFLNINVFGPGLRIAHPFNIAVSGYAKIGSNCFIYQGVTIGVNENEQGAPTIGNNVVIGAGAKIIGNIEIADNVCIGANAVVTKSILEPNTTWGGIPARKISNNSSLSYLSKYLR